MSQPEATIFFRFLKYNINRKIFDEPECHVFQNCLPTLRRTSRKYGRTYLYDNQPIDPPEKILYSFLCVEFFETDRSS